MLYDFQFYNKCLSAQLQLTFDLHSDNKTDVPIYLLWYSHTYTQVNTQKELFIHTQKRITFTPHTHSFNFNLSIRFKAMGKMQNILVMFFSFYATFLWHFSSFYLTGFYPRVAPVEVSIPL